MKNIYLIFSAILMVGFGCQKNRDKEQSTPTPVQTQTIQYGTSFGMCTGYCDKNVFIKPYEISYTETDRSSNTKTCGRSLSTQEWNSLYTKINVAEFYSLPTTIGCPDCADGGAEWIEITTANSKRRVTFEYNKAPATANLYIEDLRNYFKDFNNCNAK